MSTQTIQQVADSAVRYDRLARELENQARELAQVAMQMRRAATMLHGLRPGNRLSPEGRDKISRAAQRRWREHRERAAAEERLVKAKRAKSGNQKV